MTQATCPLIDPAEMRESFRKTCEFAADIEQRLNDGDRRFLEGDNDIAQIKKDLAENTRMTKAQGEATREMVDFYNSVTSAFKVLNWIGKLAAPLAAIIGMCTAIWGAWVIFKNGGKP